jgi:hypothetical protein
MRQLDNYFVTLVLSRLDLRVNVTIYALKCVHCGTF